MCVCGVIIIGIRLWMEYTRRTFWEVRVGAESWRGKMAGARVWLGDGVYKDLRRGHQCHEDAFLGKGRRRELEREEGRAVFGGWGVQRSTAWSSVP